MTDSTFRRGGAVLLLAASLLAITLSARPALGAAVGQAMPRFSVSDWQGNPVEIDPAKEKVLVVEFWASWCLPCREQLPAMARLAQTIDDPRLRLMAINIESDTKLVERFLDQVLPERSLPLYRDTANRLMPRFGAPGMPTTYVVVDGIVREIVTGFSEEGHRRLADLVRRSLTTD